MPVVLIHGNPETPAIWEPLRVAWGRHDIVAPNLPGFGCPVPPDFDASKEAYLAWLVAALEAIGEPVDLIGHDWGGGLVGRVAMMRPDLIRSWASDAIGLFHPRYQWHDVAAIWQTPGDGEALVAAMVEQPVAERAPGFEALGVPADAAEVLAGGVDATMGACILALYRSAIQPAMAAWGTAAGDARATPGLFLHATEDPYVGKGGGALEVAATMGAGVAELVGLGHWWMLEDPAGAAGILDAWVSAQDGRG
jgi:pimeloyl-ACP methyl ester carboxylesterase